MLYRTILKRLVGRPLLIAAAIMPLVLGLAVIAAKPGIAADDALAKRLAGTWQFVSHKRVATGEELVRRGGYVVFGADGFANYFYVASDSRTATRDAEREALLRLMLAWTGKYSTQDGKLVISNADGIKIRQVKLEGDRLTTLPVKVPGPIVAASATQPAAADFGETVLTRVK